MNRECYMALLIQMKEEIVKKTTSKEEEKVLFHHVNAPCHKTITTMAKLHELHFELLPHPRHSPDLALSIYYLFANFKKCSSEYISNEEVIAETEMYFEGLNK